MRILLITDAWHPQVNGVVRTWETVRRECEALGHHFDVIAPHLFKTVPCPTYPEIRLAINPAGKLRRLVDEAAPDAVHIATEGPVGMAGRALMLRRRLPFTTSYHTRFPEYVAARAPVPLAWGYRVMQWFHRPSSGVLVATKSIRADLEGRGFGNIRDWSRGVDLELFRQDGPQALGLPKPVFAYVGRVAVEKNLRAFLDLDLPGCKLVVGDGPQLSELRRAYPAAHFAGAQFGAALAAHYRSADVFVFPSRTDTFGLVLLEAMACGLPVAAFPVPGPRDVITDPRAGVLDDDLMAAALAARTLRPADARAHAERFGWSACARQFLDNLAPLPTARAAAA
jgi:glycosyltransferase involved in cell wall biosynthesis